MSREQKERHDAERRVAKARRNARRDKRARTHEALKASRVDELPKEKKR